MRRITDFMGWLAHDSAAARAPPRQPLDASAQPRRADRARRAAPSARARRDASVSPDQRIIRASGVTGKPVFSATGERCGRICDLSIDKRSGRVVYALIAVEGELGFLQRVVPAPWSLFRYDQAKGGYAIPAERTDVCAGPAISSEDLRRMGAGEEAWQQRLAIYYSPYLTLPFI